MLGITVLFFLLPKKKGDDKKQSLDFQNKDDSFPLSFGSKGERVKELQRILNYIKIQNKEKQITVDGYFGKETLDNCQSLLNVSKVTEADFNKFKKQTIG